jgi:hypothetical protein
MPESVGSSVNIPRWAQITLSCLIFTLICLHLIFPKWAIDSITVTLLVLLLVVWILPWIKTLKIPGGAEIQMRDILKAEESLAKSNLPQRQESISTPNAVPERQTENITLLEKILGRDPNLALANLRIEIEKRLMLLGKHQDANFSSLTGISKMIRTLRDRKVFDPEFALSLSKIVSVGNAAIHGAHVDPNVAERALNVGEELLRGLDQLIQQADTLSG